MIVFSAAKAPFLARFKVRRCGVQELERIGLEVIIRQILIISLLFCNFQSNFSFQAQSQEKGKPPPPKADLNELRKITDANTCWQAAIFKVR